MTQRKHASLTAVWTIFILCCRSKVKVRGTSTEPSVGACVRIMSMASSVPVLPTPALHTRSWFQLSSAPPPSPAVHQQRTTAVGCLHLLEEVEHWTCIFWHSMIWPRGEVVMCDLPRLLLLFQTLWVCAHVYQLLAVANGNHSPPSAVL